MPLSNEEINYYGRQLKLDSFDLKLQEKLKNSVVSIVGLGGLGCPVAETLTASGVGTINLIDFDLVEALNLHRQTLYGVKDLGRNKVEAAKERLSERNPYCTLESRNQIISTSNALELLKNSDLVIDASDNADTRLIVSDACYELNIPCISGALFAWEAHLYHFEHGEQGLSYRDLFPEGALNANNLSCADTGVLNSLCSILGAQMARLAFLELIEAEHRATNGFEHYDYLTNRWTHFKADVNPKNPQRNNSKSVNYTISPRDLENLRVDQKLELVDVRDPDEFITFNLGGINIPLDQLDENRERIVNLNKVVFVCETGIRSATALNWAKEQTPNTEVYHLLLGIQALKKVSNV